MFNIAVTHRNGLGYDNIQIPANGRNRKSHSTTVLSILCIIHNEGCDVGY